MRKYFFIIIVYIALVCIDSNISAANEQVNILNLKRLEEEHHTSSSAIGISVNSNGDIAIGFEDYYINIYDKDGNFKFTFSFDDFGSYFFDIDNYNNIMIFTVRGSICYYYNTEAELIKINEISDIAESSIYYRENANRRFVSGNGVDYILKQPFGYTKLIKKDAEGNETVIYEIGSFYLGKIVFAIGILIFILIASLGLIKICRTEMDRYKISKL